MKKLTKDDIDWDDEWNLRDEEDVHPSHRIALIDVERLRAVLRDLDNEAKNNMSNPFKSEVHPERAQAIRDCMRILRENLRERFGQVIDFDKKQT